MFRHEDDCESDEDEEINEDDDSEVEIDVNPETIAPCIETIRKSLEKVTIPLKQVVLIWKCDFEAKNHLQVSGRVRICCQVQTRPPCPLHQHIPIYPQPEHNCLPTLN